MLFLKEFHPTKVKKFDIAESRKRFKKEKSKNMKFLLEKRFLWMRKYVKNKKKNY